MCLWILLCRVIGLSIFWLILVRFCVFMMMVLMWGWVLKLFRMMIFWLRLWLLSLFWRLRIIWRM